MSGDARKIERLMALTERLTKALQADIAALEKGRPRDMQSPKAEVQQMSALYAREAQAFTPQAVDSLPKEAREQLKQATARFREVLQLHARILIRVKSATEGMIRAIADDVAKKKRAARPYAPQSPPPRGCDAMLYNKVI